MPEKARVFVAEDNPKFQKAFGNILERAGHSVVSRATTLEEALQAITEFQQLEVQVAVLDGNLSPSDDSGYDGHALVEAISRLAPTVKTVGMSSLPMEGVTVDLRKRNYSRLAEIVTYL